RPAPAAPPPGEEYVLVDGYNVIFSWKELKELAQVSLADARSRLVERLRSYQGFRQCPVIVVFDAYRVKGNPGSVERLGGLTVVYTKEAETADAYIEKTAHAMGRARRVRVVTSDGLEQVIILGGGALRVPAPAFEAEVRQVEDSLRRFLADSPSRKGISN
ncbi:MAG: NYN domain-containing protein, partial [Oscillospiraceae bacterium]|nr:NYN domain-containing protein [Oscillospiraceae bacterium]